MIWFVNAVGGFSAYKIDHHVVSFCQTDLNLALKSLSVFLSTVSSRKLISILTNTWSLCPTTSVNSQYLNKCHNCNENS